MKETKNISRSRAQESSAAIEKCTSQRHLQQGFINQWVFQETHCVKHCYVTSGNIRKHCRRKVELNGLLYVIERLPVGIEEDLLTLL
jgi:hypothetical protein